MLFFKCIGWLTFIDNDARSTDIVGWSSLANKLKTNHASYDGWVGGDKYVLWWVEHCREAVKTFPPHFGALMVLKVFFFH